MPSLIYDSAGLAIVAYADVVGSDGSSTTTNSGVVTARTGTGQYDVVLPSDKQQSLARDLIVVTPKGPITSVPYSAKVDDSDPATKKVGIYGGSPLATFADADFSILILRTVIPQ
jgi:hypothetical protein